MAESRTSRGDPVEIGRTHKVTSGTPEVVESVLVGHDEENVGG
jgi:hypothetical protein